MSYIEIQSAKGIKNPIQAKVEVNPEKIYWYIRFNIPLNPETVNEESMDVTDVEGFILTSVISYSAENNTIIISPREPYKPNETYILNISDKVCSRGNNPLKEEVQIVFQLKGAEIGRFKILKGKERLDIDIKPSRHAPTPSQLKKDKLPIVPVHINFFVAIGAMLAFIAALLISNHILMMAATVLLLCGIAHIVVQYTGRSATSIRNYNKGATHYNTQEFGEAAIFFDLALMQNTNNIFAQRGQKRLSSGAAAQKSAKRGGKGR